MRHGLRLAFAAAVLALASVSGGGPAMAEGAASAAPDAAARVKDWAWLEGRWTVRHRKLRARLAGSSDWDEFEGSCVNWPTLGGLGNVDDNWFNAPGGAYRGVGVRAFDPATGQWSIWWLDSRFPDKVDVPVRGKFVDGVGVFESRDTFEGKPIRVRFTWSRITRTSARWEQAFSADDGRTWETNWTMEFTRAG